MKSKRAAGELEGARPASDKITALQRRAFEAAGRADYCAALWRFRLKILMIFSIIIIVGSLTNMMS